MFLLLLKRLFAFIFDFVIASLLLLLFIGNNNPLVYIVYIYSLLILIEFVSKGRSVGKYIFKLKLIGINENSPSLYQVAVRVFIITLPALLTYILKSLFELGLNTENEYTHNIGIIISGLGTAIWLSIIFGKGSIGLHDYIANTCVVNNNENEIKTKKNISFIYLILSVFFLLFVKHNFNYLTSLFFEGANKSYTISSLRDEIINKWIDSKKMSQSIYNASEYIDFDKGVTTWAMKSNVRVGVGEKVNILNFNFHEAPKNTNSENNEQITNDITSYQVNLDSLTCSYYFKKNVARYIANKVEKKNPFYLIFQYNYSHGILLGYYRKKFLVYALNNDVELYDEFDGSSIINFGFHTSHLNYRPNPALDAALRDIFIE